MNIEKIIENLTYIREQLDYKPSDSPLEVISKMEKLSGVMGLANETQAWAESLYNTKAKTSISYLAKGGYSDERRINIDADSSLELRSFNIAKGYVKSIYSQMDYYRSRLSMYNKEYSYERKNI